MRVFIASLLLACTTIGAALADTTGGIRGYVYDVNNYPRTIGLAGVRITIRSPWADVVTTSDRRGFFVVLGLAPGYYTISAQEMGFTPKSITRCVSAGFVESVRFDLDSVLRDPAYIRYIRWKPLPLDPGKTSDVYNLLGDRQRPC